LARDHAAGKIALPGIPTTGFKVSERHMTMGEIAKLSEEGKLKEMFGAGTAAIVTSINK
jgi:branched-chain amino acid aminotransferase